MTAARQETGRRGEQLAARFLEREGCRVVARNCRCPLGELDLVAEGPEGLIFVEVRTRRTSHLVSPEETITRPKALRVVRSAQWYLSSHGLEDRPWRVDVIAVELDARGELARLERYKDATAGLVSDGY